MKPIIFLDIDGVLNDHAYNTSAESSTLLAECVDNLNIVIAHTRCEFVISSAWRYMVHGGDLTARGFGYLLQTHGLRVKDRILGVTRKDKSPDEPRANQVNDWWGEQHELADGRPWVVLDDLDLGFTRQTMPFVQTDGAKGISDANVRELIEMLGGDQ